MDKIVFKTEKKDFRFKDIVNALKKAGLKKGCTIMVQSGLDTFGKLGDILNKEEYANTFINAFLEVLGKEGTLLVPTFTYSFCRGEIYDLDNTPVSNIIEKLGILPEVFRKRKDATRSINPIFSVAGIGKLAKKLLTDLSHNCFGIESIYDRLSKIKNSKYCVFGVPYYSNTYVHFIERISGVPYRYVKKFKGKIRLKGREFEEEYEYYVRYLDKNINTDFSKLEKHLLDRKLLKVVPLGNGFVKVAKISDIVREGEKMLRKNPLFFLKNKPEIDENGKEMYELIRKLYSIKGRSITGRGTEKTLKLIKEHIPIQIKRIPTGKKVFDWKIPKEWNIKDVWIKDSKGKKIVDFQDSDLHILNYSVPIHKKLSLTELKKHLHTLPEHPDWIPYRTSYYNSMWGFCMRYNQFKELKEGIYEVKIDSTLKNGYLNYCELLIKGKSDEEILFSTYVCHSMCNDNLSGVVLLTFLAKELLKNKNLKYSYRFLFAPETIGSIVYLSQNESKISKIKAGLVARFLGDYGNAMTYKKSRMGNAFIDKVVEKALIDSRSPYKIIDFDPSKGGDERQYNSIGINLDIGVLMRDHHFPEYHTSADDLSIISSENLADALKRYLDVVFILENNETYLNLNPKCEPQLGKRGLYRTIGSRPSHEIDETAIMWILNLSDGTNSLLDISVRSGIDFKQIKKSADVLAKKKLLKNVL